MRRTGLQTALFTIIIESFDAKTTRRKNMHERAALYYWSCIIINHDAIPVAPVAAGAVYDSSTIKLLSLYVRTTAKRVEGRALNYVVRMAKNSNTLSERLSLACRRNGSARQTRRGRRREERERRRRKKEGKRKKEDRRIHLGVTS